MESAIELFVETLKANSALKGSRWDDIVFKFEYSALIVPRLLAHIATKPKACQNFLSAKVRAAKVQELDEAAINAFVEEIEVIEKESEVKYESIVARVINESHERIKHSQLQRLQALTDS